MKIKNPILASMLSKLGVQVKAELIIDDSNGTSLTFPDISEVSEIAQGVAIMADDATYVIADGDNTITIDVLAGAVTAVVVAEPEAAEATAELDVEVQTVLETLVEASVKSNALIVALQTELKDLKVSLKHEDGKAPAAAADKTKQPSFKIVG